MTEEEELQLEEPEVFDDLEIEAALHKPPVNVPRVPSTQATAERYAFLKTKRIGETWMEGDTLFRRTSNGVTAFNFRGRLY